ncbi:hypothetical protein RI367_004977 [Sorochytrium milnesiophthora]
MSLLLPQASPLDSADAGSDLCRNVPADSANLVLSVLLAIGIVLSYLPQHIKIIMLRSSEGLSPWFLLLGGIASVSTFYNILLLQFPIVECCTSWPLGQCLEHTLGIIQVGSQLFMFTLIITLYMVYFPPALKHVIPASEYTPLLRPPPGQPPTVQPTSSQEDDLPRTRLWNISISMALTVLVYFLLVTVLSIGFLMYSETDHHLPGVGAPYTPPTTDAVVVFAGLLGAVATLMSCLQFIPQIVKTFTTKRVGALSIVMMCIQTPGTLLLVYSLSLRPGTNLSTYLSYLVAASLQGTLLVLSLMYTYVSPSSEMRTDYHEVNVSDEDVYGSQDVLVVAASPHRPVLSSPRRSASPTRSPRSSGSTSPAARVHSLAHPSSPGQLLDLPNSAVQSLEDVSTPQLKAHVTFPNNRPPRRTSHPSVSALHTSSPPKASSSSPKLAPVVVTPPALPHLQIEPPTPIAATLAEATDDEQTPRPSEAQKLASLPDLAVDKPAAPVVSVDEKPIIDSSVPHTQPEEPTPHANSIPTVSEPPATDEPKSEQQRPSVEQSQDFQDCVTSLPLLTEAQSVDVFEESEPAPLAPKQEQPKEVESGKEEEGEGAVEAPAPTTLAVPQPPLPALAPGTDSAQDNTKAGAGGRRPSVRSSANCLATDSQVIATGSATPPPPSDSPASTPGGTPSATPGSVRKSKGKRGGKKKRGGR